MTAKLSRLYQERPFFYPGLLFNFRAGPKQEQAQN
jgi:hypothetical protein